MTVRTYQNLGLPFQTGMCSHALFREYPIPGKAFISLADLVNFFDKKSKQEIHTLDEFATFPGV